MRKIFKLGPPYDVLAHSRSFLANEKARNAIVRAENLLMTDTHMDREKVTRASIIYLEHFLTVGTLCGYVFLIIRTQTMKNWDQLFQNDNLSKLAKKWKMLHHIGIHRNNACFGASLGRARIVCVPASLAHCKSSNLVHPFFSR